MRPSLVFVRCWFSSTDFDRVSTLSFTSPTRCRTIFLVAHALVPTVARAVIAIAPISLFIAVAPYETRPPLPRLTSDVPAGAVAAARVHHEVLVLRPYRDRAKALAG